MARKNKSGYKCPVCNGCMKWIYVVNHRFTFCLFCDTYYRLHPGPELVKSSLEEIERIWKEEVWG